MFQELCLILNPMLQDMAQQFTGLPHERSHKYVTYDVAL